MTNFAPSPVDGRLLPVVADYPSHHWSAQLLHRVGASDEWELFWTDGINVWTEHYEVPWTALARLAALVAAVEQDVFLVHRSDDPHGPPDFVAEAERFVSRTIHASSCAPDCDGTDPVNHQV